MTSEVQRSAEGASYPEKKAHCIQPGTSGSLVHAAGVEGLVLKILDKDACGANAEAVLRDATVFSPSCGSGSEPQGEHE